jgi:hypothetical protein
VPTIVKHDTNPGDFVLEFANRVAAGRGTHSSIDDMEGTRLLSCAIQDGLPSISE